MNKRTREKVAKRLNGGVKPAAQPVAVKASAQPAAKKKVAARKPPTPTGAVDRARAAVGSAVDEAKSRVVSAVDEAKSLVVSVVDEAKSRVEGKVADLKDKLHDTEQQAEEALRKIPVVGNAAADKLHELTK